MEYSVVQGNGNGEGTQQLCAWRELVTHSGTFYQVIYQLYLVSLWIFDLNRLLEFLQTAHMAEGVKAGR